MFMKYKDSRRSIIQTVNVSPLFQSIIEIFLLQALLEHWWRPLYADEKNEGNENGPIHI